MKTTIKTLFLMTAALVLAVGCFSEPYKNNAQMNTLYRMLNNYQTSFKERALFFEMVSYAKLVEDGKFYISGAGISTPGSYSCEEGETIISAIGRAGQTSSYDGLSYTLITGFKDNEREVSGLVITMGAENMPEVHAGDLIYLKSLPKSVALSHE